MKMIKCYAVEPKALRRYEDFRYVMEKLGFDKGAVLVTIPGKWVKELLTSLNDIGDIERSRFVTKLERYKRDRILPSGAPYDPSLYWIDNATALESAGVVDNVLISEDTFQERDNVRYLTPSQIDESFFEVRREVRCLNTPENLGLAAGILLQVSPEVTLVDPHFRIDSNAYLKTLTMFAKYAAAGGRCKRFTIVTRIDYAPKRGVVELRRRMDSILLPLLSDGFKVDVLFLDRQTTQVSFHARYLLTTKGGMRYDKGFRSEDPPEIVDISLLDIKIHEELIETFSKSNEELKIAETWEWSANAGD